QAPERELIEAGTQVREGHPRRVGTERHGPGEVLVIEDGVIVEACGLPGEVGAGGRRQGFGYPWRERWGAVTAGRDEEKWGDEDAECLHDTLTLPSPGRG